MQQVILRRERMGVRPPLRLSAGAGLLFIACASAMLTSSLHPAALLASSRMLGPSAAVVGEMVAGRQVAPESVPATVLAMSIAQPEETMAVPTIAPVVPLAAMAAAPTMDARTVQAIATAFPALPTPAVVAPAVRSGPAVGFFLTGQWVKNHRDSALYASPDPGAYQFTTLPQWSVLRVVEVRQDWLKVYFLGDQDGRVPGEAWMPAADVGPVDRPTLWATALGTADVSAETASAPSAEARLQPGSLVEVVGPLQGPRVQVRFPGDGKTVPPGQGWVEASLLQPLKTPPAGALPWAYPYTVDASVLRIATPYRSQIDGSVYQAANCGPTVVGMVLLAFGMDVPAPLLRAEVLDDQQEWGDDTGSYIWALADVVQHNGIQARGLYTGPPNEDRNGPFHVWTADEIREQVRAGRLVIPQVLWRGLPGREDHDYYGDHYIVITGLVGDAFLYNDPVDRDGVGYDRLMSADTLLNAMNESQAPGAAFAVSR